MTGTDTGVGKTTVCCHLLSAMAEQGLKTLALKPVASGAEKVGRTYKNDDALKLQAASTVRQSYAQVNPFCFKEPIAPHLAANKARKKLSVDALLKACEPTLKRKADCIIVEGAGGWQVPLNDHETLADFAKRLGYPVILVVGMRLGCLNHALMSIAQIEQAGLPIVGWFANCIDPEFEYLEENIETLQRWIPYDMLGRLEFTAKDTDIEDKDAPAEAIDSEEEQEPHTS